MRGIHRKAVVLAASVAVAATSAGCQGSPARRSLAASEPALTQSESSGGVIIDGEAPAKVAVVPSSAPSVVDRHPLLSRPRLESCR